MEHNDIYSIVERLAILEGRIAPKDTAIVESTETKQKKPALFNNLKRDESVNPGVAGVEFAEEKSDDVLSRVKASLVDYLKSAEENIKQDKDLIAKKKQDLDLKKKELRDLELQQKKKEVDEAIPMGLEEDKLNVGDPIIVTAPNEYKGMTGEVSEFSPSGKFVIVKLYNADNEVPMHLSDVEYNQYADDEDEFDASEQQGFKDQIEEEPNQTPANGEAPAGLTDPTYAAGSNNTYAESAPVKTVELDDDCLCEIHGDETRGFEIRHKGRIMPSKFKNLDQAQMALDMFKARRAKQQAGEVDTDYIEEK